MEINSGNYNKYVTKNLFMKIVINHFLNELKNLVEYDTIEYILDIGCGEGFVINFLNKENHHIYHPGTRVRNISSRNLL